MEEIIDVPAGELQANTSLQKRTTDLLKEIWSQVVTTYVSILLAWIRMRSQLKHLDLRSL